MGLKELIFGKKEEPKRRDETFFRLLDGYRPVFHSWDGELYERELIRTAIDARARHVSKMKIEVKGTAQPHLQTMLKLGPNEWQTWGQFLYRVSTILDVKNTALIVPVVNDYGDTTGVFPVFHKEVELVESGGVQYIRIRFANDERAAVELDKVGILTRYQYKNDFFGENNRALDPTLELLNIQDQGIEQGVKNAATYKFMATVSNFSDPDDLKKERKKFTRENLRGKDLDGVLLWPNTYKDVKQIEAKPYVADPDQMKQIRENVFYYFGVNEEILTNAAIGDAWSAFYEGSVEPFAIQLSDVLTRMLFTHRERQQGSFIMATSNRMQYMTNKDKLEVSAEMADRGLMTRNEIREIWNLTPLPDEIGSQLPIRGEYYVVGERTRTNGGKNDG
ncbi:MAG: phage portal protein [Clostridia bacterium]|nr:phage portal protein [Clostridia bacterium]